MPCEGAIWAAGRVVITPRFGIDERSGVSAQAITPASERQGAGEDELEAIGGFAFGIEAAESLNLVTRFFLQHAVRFDDQEQMQLWLMKFKELDLRLIKYSS